MQSYVTLRDVHGAAAISWCSRECDSWVAPGFQPSTAIPLEADIIRLSCDIGFGPDA
jgi:hypothetical protein